MFPGDLMRISVSGRCQLLQVIKPDSKGATADQAIRSQVVCYPVSGSLFLPLIRTSAHLYPRVWRMGMLAAWGRQGGGNCGGGSGTPRENHTTQTRAEEVRGSSVDWRGPKVGRVRGKGGGVAELGESWGVSDEERGWREERRGRGVALPVAIPASPHWQPEREREY